MDPPAARRTMGSCSGDGAAEPAEAPRPSRRRSAESAASAGGRVHRERALPARVTSRKPTLKATAESPQRRRRRPRSSSGAAVAFSPEVRADPGGSVGSGGPDGSAVDAGGAQSPSLESSWASLAFFGRTNQGRMLTFTDVTAEMTAPEESVHFLNVRHSDASDAPAAAPAPAEGGPALFQRFEPVDRADGSVGRVLNSAFEIPTLPEGRVLQLNIVSTWGDPYYVGLQGIEVFDHAGHKVRFEGCGSISAAPSSINDLEEYENDPRTVDNLLNGFLLSCDDTKSWLAPFTPGGDHTITIELPSATRVSMIRVWNYNKSRIHSYRGARYVEMQLDGRPIFKGEIQRAMGTLDLEQSSETILFTMSESILGVIEKYDEYLNLGWANGPEPDCEAPRRPVNIDSWLNGPRADPTDGILDPMPSRSSGASWGCEASCVSWDTRNTRNTRNSSTAGSATGRGPGPGPGPGLGPAAGHGHGRGRGPGPGPAHPNGRLELLGRAKPLSVRDEARRPSAAPSAADPRRGGRPPGRATAASRGRPLQVCASLSLEVVANWGDPDHVGVTGVQLLDERYAPLSLEAGRDALESSPAIEEAALRRLFCGSSEEMIARGAAEMLLTPRSAGLALAVRFGAPVLLSGIKVFNFNGGVEESFCGVRRMLLRVDGRVHGPQEGLLVRKAPGDRSFDFGQFIELRTSTAGANGGAPAASESLPANGGAPAAPPALPANGRAPAASESLPANAAPAPRFRKSAPGAESSGPPGTPGPPVPEEGPATERLGDLALCGAFAAEEDRRRASPVCDVPQQYEAPLLPCGCILKFVLLSTHGDAFYIGLNGLRLYDASGSEIALSAENLSARPRDVAELEGYGQDPRTLEQLYSDAVDDDAKTWLAPLIGPTSALDRGRASNCVTAFFDEPKAIGMVSIWNYRRDPRRGVCDFEMYMDDVLIYKGVLKRAPPPEESCADFEQVVLFTNAAPKDVRAKVFTPEADLLFIDEGVTVSTAEHPETPLQRPFTSVGRRKRT